MIKSGFILLAFAMVSNSCLLPARKGQDPQAPRFLEDDSLLLPSKKVRQAYLSPDVDLRSFESIRIPDFENFSGRDIHSQAVVIMAEALASELERFPQGRRPFNLIDRSPRTAAPWVDLVLEGAITIYEVKTDAYGRDRLSNQVVVGIECRIVRSRDREIVALIRHRTKQNLPYVGFENPVRDAMWRLAQGVAAFLAEPDVEPGGLEGG